MWLHFRMISSAFFTARGRPIKSLFKGFIHQSSRGSMIATNSRLSNHYAIIFVITGARIDGPAKSNLNLNVYLCSPQST